MSPGPNPPSGGGAVAPLLSVERLRKEFGRARGRRGRPSVGPAVDGVSFSVARGETVGLVGESGSGKSTTARCILGLLRPTSGRVLFDDVEVAALGREQMRQLRCRMQVLFQDPFASLDPRMSCEAIVAEPLAIHGRAGGRGGQRVAKALTQVGLDPALGVRKPHALSGGQRQRIALARALILGPEFLVLDEPVSALDVSVQAQVINLLRSLQRELGLTYLIILHDLVIARYVCDRIAVMQRGRIVEIAPTDQLFANPTHAYTRELMVSVPGRAKVPSRPVRDGQRGSEDALPLREVAEGHWAAVAATGPPLSVESGGRLTGGRR